MPEQRPILRIDRVDAANPPTVRLFVTELDADLKVPAADAKPTYRLQVNALPQKVTPKVELFRDIREPMVAMLVMQVSPAMKPIFDDAIAGAAQLLDELPEGSLAGLVAYAEALVEQLKPTSPKRVQAALKKLGIQDDALELNLPFAVQEALDNLKRPQLPKRRVVIVISDGLTADLHIKTFSKLARAARSDDIKIHTIGFAPLEPAGLRTLYELSGGKRGDATFRATTSPAELQQALAALRAELAEQRVLSYSLPQFFTGEVADFQVDNGSGAEASEPAEMELVRWEPPAEAGPWYTSPWLVAALIAILLAGGTAGGMFYWRLRSNRIEALRSKFDDSSDSIASTPAQTSVPAHLWQNDAAPEHGQLANQPPQSPLVSDAPPPSEVTTAANDANESNEPKTTDEMLAATFDEGRSASPEPIRDADVIGESPAEPDGGAASDDDGDFPVLPSPAEFLKAARSDSEAGQRESDDVGRKEESTQQASATYTAERTPPTGTMRSGTLPPQRDPLLPEPPSAAATIEPYAFDKRKTQVIAIDEVEKVDVIAWVVSLSQKAPTTHLLQQGFSIGTKNASVVVESGHGEDETATFHRNSRGQWTLSATGNGTPLVLRDNDRFSVGDDEFLFKQAARFDEETLAKPCLQVVGGIDDGRRIPLSEDTAASIGSDQSCNALVRGEGVAARHLLAWLENGACQVADLGSEAGLRVSNRTIGKTELKIGDEVQAGAIRLVFRHPENRETT